METFLVILLAVLSTLYLIWILQPYSITVAGLEEKAKQINNYSNQELMVEYFRLQEKMTHKHPHNKDRVLYLMLEKEMQIRKLI